jgi:hypothetical protein
MSIALFALADASISELKKSSPKKPMPKRVYTASPDRTAAPEPR